MNIFVGTFQAVAIVFFICTIGFFLVRKKVIPSQFLGSLSTFVLELALPSFVFTKLITNFNPETASSKLQLPIYWGGFTLILFLLTLAGSYLAAKDNRREFKVSLFFPNAMFIPIILITEQYGPNSPHLINLFLFTLFFPAFFFNSYALFFGRKAKNIDWKKTIHPVLIAIIAAILIKLTALDQYIPNFVGSALKLIGNTTVPLLMIVLGGIIYIDFKDRGKINWFEIIKFVLLKNITFPAIILALLYILRVPKDIAFIITLLSAVPPLSVLPVVMDRVNGNRKIVNQFLIFSTSFSIISLPIVMVIFDKLFS